MSTHKATAARCLSYHQAASGQHAIWALAMAPLRRLALSVLFTIAATSYQTTLYSLREIFNKRQHANATYRVEFSHYDNTPLHHLIDWSDTPLCNLINWSDIPLHNLIGVTPLHTT